MTANDILNNTKYQQACKRADRFGVVVLGKVKTKGGIFLGWAVKGNSKPAHFVQRYKGVLVCDCQAAQNTMYCMHRAAVTRNLIEAAKEDAEASSEVYGALDTLTSTERNDSARDAWVENDALRDAAIMARHDSGPRLYR